MTKRILYVTVFNILMGLIAANAQEAKKEQSQEKARSSKFEQFMSRKDALIVSKRYQIGRLEETSADTWVSSAWELGQSEKFYAAVINNHTIDFEHLQDMLNAMDRMISAIPAEFDKLGATSMRLSTESGFGMSYYAYDTPSGPKRNLYLQIRGTQLYQGPSLEPLTKLRELISQARQKLVSLGAK